MRIAYVALHLEKNVMEGGVGGKIKSQVRLWREFGHDGTIFLLSQQDVQMDGIRSFPFDQSQRPPLIGGLVREFMRIRALGELIEAVARYKPDLIYLRYGLYSPPLGRLFKIAPVVVELNSNDIDEYRSRGLFYYILNRWTRRITLGRSSGIIAPTTEIANYPENQRMHRPVRMISNGVDLDWVECYPPPNNELPVLVFAGSPGYNWHGVDKLVELARMCPDLRIEIVGFEAGDFNDPEMENLRFHGFVRGDAMAQILSRADVALGTLALHRKNMEQASPLKIREALACGIPVIIAYKDTDLMDWKTDCLLELPNTEENVKQNTFRIRQFCYEMRGKRVKRELISSRIDQRVKEKMRLALFDEVINSNKTN